MNHLEEVRKAVIAAVPNILDLKFGCQFTIQGADRIIVGAWPEDGQWLSVHPIDGGPQELTKTMLDYGARVIGRPIRLADVLIAMSDIRVSEIEISSPCGHPTAAGIVFKKGKRIALWVLNKDSLDDQSEEVISFLYKILCL